jgi:hypothetical protein
MGRGGGIALPALTLMRSLGLQRLCCLATTLVQRLAGNVILNPCSLIASTLHPVATIGTVCRQRTALCRAQSPPITGAAQGGTNQCSAMRGAVYNTRPCTQRTSGLRMPCVHVTFNS